MKSSEDLLEIMRAFLHSIALECWIEILDMLEILTLFKMLEILASLYYC